MVSGRGVEEAPRRADAYSNAAADAILIHSKRSQPDEVLGFCRRWDGRCPVLVVPTTYYRTPADIFRAAGVSGVIWANHALRASIKAMREACLRIKQEESPAAVENQIATIQDIFDLVGNSEL